MPVVSWSRGGHGGLGRRVCCGRCGRCGGRQSWRCRRGRSGIYAGIVA